MTTTFGITFKKEIKILGCRDPRCKHEYLDEPQVWITISGENGDESDKHTAMDKSLLTSYVVILL